MEDDVVLKRVFLDGFTQQLAISWVFAADQNKRQFWDFFRRIQKRVLRGIQVNKVLLPRDFQYG